MSLLNVNKVDPATGTALEIGTSGDTITVPSGATFNVAGTLQSGGAAIPDNTPAFMAVMGSNDSLANSTFTKATFDTEVPIPYWLFSIIYKTGNFQIEAILNDSNTCPLFIAPSPIYVLHICFSFLYL